jgi:hypothetical protein
MGTGHLDGQVCRLSTGNAEHDTRELIAGAGRQPRRQLGPPARHEVVVAHVQVVEAPAHCIADSRVPVSQVEHPAIAVTVEVASVRVERVGEEGTLPLTHHDLQPQRPVGLDLAGIDMACERTFGGDSVRIRLCWWLHTKKLPTHRRAVAGLGGR